jgi:hypothetical protein
MKTISRVARALPLLAALALSACGGSDNNQIALTGTITGLTGSGLVLINGSNVLSIPAGSTSFVFSSRINTGTIYAIGVYNQPTDQTCLVNNATGTAGSGDVTTIQVNCVPKNMLGGSVSGLTASGLVLANGSDTVAVAANSTSFTFPNKVGQGLSYGVTVLTQPAGKTCSVANGVGTMGTTDIGNVQVSCI